MRVRVGVSNFGLALGSGGLRGAAHIGALKSLERHGLQPVCLAGSSAGAVVAALYAAGYSVAALEELAIQLDASKIFDSNLSWRTLVSLAMGLLSRKCYQPSALPLGLIKGAAWERYLASLLGQQKFTDLALPTAIMAVDVETGDGVAFASREVAGVDVTLTGATVAQAVRASSSIPGVFEPLQLYGFTLVDGAVRASVPAQLVRSLGAQVVVAIDLGYAGQREDKVDNLGEVISQSLHILGEELTRCQLEQTADLIVRPRIYNVSLRDFQRIPEIIERGEKAMEAQIPRLHQLLDPFH